MKNRSFQRCCFPAVLLAVFALSQIAHAGDDDYVVVSSFRYDFSKKSPDAWVEAKRGLTQSGAYQMKANGTIWSPHQVRRHRDVVIRSTVSYISGSDKTEYGLTFRRSDAGGYEFLINPSGVASLWVMAANKCTKLKSAEVESFDPRASNVLQVRAIGASIDCYVNGKRVFAATDSHHASGKVGFSAHSDHHVAYDEIEIEDVISLKGMKPAKARLWRKVAKGDQKSAISLLDEFFSSVIGGRLTVKSRILHEPYAKTTTYLRQYHFEGTPVAVISASGWGESFAEQVMAARKDLEDAWGAIAGGDGKAAREHLKRVVRDYNLSRPVKSYVAFHASLGPGEHEYEHTFYRQNEYLLAKGGKTAVCVFRIKESVQAPSLLVATAMLEHRLRMKRSSYMASIAAAYDALSISPEAPEAQHLAEEADGDGNYHAALGYLSAYLRGNVEKESARVAAYRKAAKIAKKMDTPPPLPPAALNFLQEARDAALDGKYARALEYYQAASTVAPWWAEPHYGRAVVSERIAWSEMDVGKDPKAAAESLRSVAKHYQLYLDTAVFSDKRIDETEDRLDRLEEIADGLEEPAKVEKMTGWPYGRPAVVIGIAGVGVRWNLYENKSLWTHRAQSDKTPDYTKIPTFSVSLAVRILPRLTVGFVGTWWNTLGAKEENLDLDLDMSASHYMGVVRYEVIQESQWGDYSTLWIEGGGGYLTAEGDFTWEGDGKQELEADGPAFCVGVGIEYHWGGIWGIEIFSRLFLSPDIDVHDVNTGDKLVGINYTNWEVIGVRALLSF